MNLKRSGFKVNVKELVNSGNPYNDFAPEVAKARDEARELTRNYNNKVNLEGLYDKEIISNLVGSHGENFTIESNFRCEFGFNISFGENFYGNHDLIILDCNQVTIGDDVLFGPRVGLYAANHAQDPVARAAGDVYSKPITIGDKVWLCGDVSVAPGVTIGENSIIGTGSVVVKDIPANVVAAGNPCKVIKSIYD
ncbi:sugar O-acetyltransferase [Carnobacterium gallinarum]|uniref:sugar O-acetyltransferase n=1 Tax=Carnobacterium gallinarum TaxID=2749 RepID=UPI0014705227|nr:sugar O-acetyltransferase [Carnobacterium gallinarum]